MSVYCKYGGQCVGCMSCRSDESLRCPVCGTELERDNRIYMDSSGQIVGCCDCIEEKEAWEVLSVDRRWKGL